MIISILAVLLTISLIISVVFYKHQIKILESKNTEKQQQLISEHEQICMNLLDRIEATDKSYNESIDEFEKELELNATFHTELYTHLNSILTYMKDIDLRGAFEADDEVGSVFKDMLVAIEALKPYVAILESNGNTEEKTKEERSEK